MSGSQSLLAGTSLSSSIFTEIPTNIEVPGTYVQVQPVYGNVGLLAYPARILLIAQMTAAGSATPGRIYPILTPEQGTTLCGPGSIGEAMVLRALQQTPTIPIDLVAVADAAGAAKAAGSFAIGGAWTTAGVLALSVAGVRIQVPVQASDTPAIVAANAVALINAQLNPDLPVTALQGTMANTNTALLTAVNGGTEANNIALAYSTLPSDSLPKGMTVTVTAMTGGTLNPSITPVLTAIAGLLYSDIITPWQDAANLGLQATDLTARYMAMAHLDATAWYCITGSYGAIQTAKATLNSQFRSAIGVTNPQSPPWEIAAAFGVACAQSLFNDPSRQCKGLVLNGIVAPLQADRIQEQEQQLLLQEGISTFDVLSDGTVVTQKVVTENTTDTTGTLTTAWHDVMAPKVATRIRYDWRAYVALTYPSNKLADDGSLAADNDPTIATCNRLRGSWGARCNVYGKQGWIEDVQNQVRNSVFSRDQNDRNRVNSTQPFLRVGNLMVLATMLQFQA